MVLKTDKKFKFFKFDNYIIVIKLAYSLNILILN